MHAHPHQVKLSTQGNNLLEFSGRVVISKVTQSVILIFLEDAVNEQDRSPFLYLCGKLNVGSHILIPGICEC